MFSQFIDGIPNHIRDKFTELAHSVITKQDFFDLERN